MDRRVPGIHHVTALAGDPQENLDFYAGLLGLRLVKRTVNYDDPSVLHLYYGDREGRPGSVLTFFPWPQARRGTVGPGVASAVAFSIPPASVDFWTGRLRKAGAEVQGPEERFGVAVVAVEDPDGLRVELAADPDAEERGGWGEGSVPPEHAVRGLYGVTLLVREAGATVDFLREAFGLSRQAEEGGRILLRSAGEAPGRVAEVVGAPDGPSARLSAGTIHHVAWRAGDEDDQDDWRRRLVERGRRVSEPRDRHYFRSIYFREPGGVLFEMATESPGFTADEAVEELGSGLRLPPWLEPRRAELEERLPPVEVPDAG